MPGPKPTPIFDRLVAHAEWDGDCLVWTQGCDPKGYGRMHVAGSGRLTHRLMWAEQFGPTDLHVLHSCDNPPCMNPAHLWLGTNAENTADKIAKGRARYKDRQTVCQRGHPFDETNTYMTPDGRRNCLRCRRKDY